MSLEVECENVPIPGFKWLQARRIKYGKAEVWEAVTRTTKKGDIDGVACLPLVYTEGQEQEEVLLISQFRPPLARRCVEFPAGLADPGESPLDTAVRELKEETGYTGTCQGTSPVIAGEAGLTDNTLRVVCMHVDSAAAANQRPEPRLDHEEEVLKLRTHRLPLRGLQQALDRLALKEDYVIDSRLYAFALGIAFHDGQPLMHAATKRASECKSQAEPSEGATQSHSRASSGAEDAVDPRAGSTGQSALDGASQKPEIRVKEPDLDRNTVGVMLSEIDDTVLACIGDAFKNAFSSNTRAGTVVLTSLAGLLAVSTYLLGRAASSRS